MDVTSFSASFASEGDEKEDNTDEDEEEETRMQQSLLGFYRKYNLSMLEEKEIAVSFGVRTDDASTVTCPLNDTNAGRAVDFELSTPTPMKRSISFNDVVQLNHVDSFKHELSTQEKEQCWYTDVEQVIMKIDGGAFDTAGTNAKKQEEEEEKARQQQQQRARTGTLTKAEEKRAKEMRKKYGIDKKVKKNRSKSIEAGASSAFFATDQTRARRTQELRASAAAAAEQKTQEQRAKDLRQKYQIDKKLQVQEINDTSASVTALTRSTDADAAAATTSTTKKKKKKGFSSLFGKKKKK
eukprot:CAMPEP_0170914110 /NCGR_PEP_ID=MMETSP0735-20130129/5387_1 /TAXON_ID=186038 /ORGANISM="Fragilariopsis kerguelensis, Strain L26-C5" /LENGTH=296 /DNA_ID=CAMNT_0011311725 /DNA_START=243 /DNA_END=1133 /DNA_ORIENTATION=+